jgi:hypothetical protein
MSAFGTIAGRIRSNRAIAAVLAATALGALVLATEIPSTGLPLEGGSVALAELLARSPGARVGGVALKAKSLRTAIAPAATSIAPPSKEYPRNAFASVLGTSAGPEEVLPDTSPIGPGGFPTDFTNPVAPGESLAAPPAGTTPGTGGAGPGILVPVVTSPGVGTPVIGPGGSGVPPVVAPTQPPTSPPTTTTPTLPPTIPGVPEPATWTVMILGFGVIGSALRKRQRVRMA